MIVQDKYKLNQDDYSKKVKSCVNWNFKYHVNMWHWQQYRVILPRMNLRSTSNVFSKTSKRQSFRRQTNFYAYFWYANSSLKCSETTPELLRFHINPLSLGGEKKREKVPKLYSWNVFTYFVSVCVCEWVNVRNQLWKLLYPQNK